MNSVQLLLLCDFLLATVLAEPTCPFKECTCGMTDIMCSELHLLTMPRTITPNNTYFKDANFDRNNFTVITSGSLPANLTSMSFQETPITFIDDDAFDGSADTLTSLTFFQVKFIKLPDAFGHLRALTFLSMSESSIQDWNVDALKQMAGTVQTLALEKLVIKEWPSWLQFFTNLTDLGIGSSLISSIPDNGLDAQINTLTDLTLNNNSLKTVPKAISKLTALKELALDKNKITDIQWLPQKSKLEALSLNGNKLHDSNKLSDLVRIYEDTLFDFNIQGNQLSSFPILDFLTHVSSLDFVHNKLSDPDSGSLPADLSELKMKGNSLPRIPRIISNLQKLTEIFLGSNAITHIEGTSFPPHSRGVELENNQITELTDTSFPPNSSITYILLTNNPLVSISDNAFVNLPHLVELNLVNTRMTRLPLALNSLTKIDVFDITNTPTLVCTCLEKGLQEWFKLMRPEMVKGTCGRTTILYFYSVLSPDCP